MNPWSTACKDWEDRILAGEPLVPELPLFASEAARGLRYFKQLRIPDLFGTPTLAEACGEWFFPVVSALFGSYDPALNVRMIQEYFLLIPKKNAKSSNGGAIMVVALLMNKRPSAEFLLIAPTKEIADIAFKQASGTVMLDPVLKAKFHIQRHIRLITYRPTGATLQIKAADTDVITGSKATGTMIDETHVFAKKANAADVFVELRGALTARPDGFLFQTTTQSKAPPVGVFKSELNMARRVRDGEMDLPLLPILYELPLRLTKDGGWKNRKLWGFVNPNMGRSVNEDFLARELLKAEEEGPAQLALLASQHFNVEIGQGLRSDGWAGAALWPRGADKGLTLAEVIRRSEVLTVGLDGGGLDDLLGIFVLGREKGTGNWLGWAHAFISPEGWARRKANHSTYQDFIKDGDLTLVERLPDDVAAVVDIVRECRDSGKLAKVGADPAGLGSIVDALADIGVTQENELLVGVRQGVALMGAIKTVERKLADGSFKHGGRRMMAWCAGNAIVQATGTGMRIARDASGYGKVDPLMAGFDAVAEMSLNPASRGSIFDRDELWKSENVAVQAR
ncbi:terminase large subunit [Tardiphaga sp.]|uniref:terminase large subunit n=1 Tax=Tardiphaga sp. TaxID=1926292 RepID=UPI00262E5133|nr:terminase large subunit [Tardiphaga sp.]MDB5618455.1 Terminase [Tardiphaga sp.]